MKTYATSVWLAEFHRQWFAARGKDLSPRSRPFSRDWNKLLDDAGVLKAEDVETAKREAAALDDGGKVVLKRHRYRKHIIEGVALPLASEGWLRDLFQSSSPESLLDSSLNHVHQYAKRTHALYPGLWDDWCEAIRSSFSNGRNHRPLLWRSPESVQEILNLVYGLTSRAWTEGTLIREASVAIGLDSKTLEQRQRIVESALASFFCQSMPLESLGIVRSTTRVEVAGPLCLHFADREAQTIGNYRGVYHVTTDLEQAVQATTTARCVLTVENSKTTLRRLAALNLDGEVLLVGCSFPTRGVKRLLEILPADLPLYHFGDTDPAGFFILSKLRETSGRPITPHLMQRRTLAAPRELTDYDRSLLPRLIADPLLPDVRLILEEIQSSGDKGDYEQETLEPVFP